MLKLKYYSLSKEEKRKLKSEFYTTPYGKNLNARLTRLLITGFLGILFGLFLILKPSNNWDIYTGIVLGIVSIIFVVSSIVIRPKKLNAYLIKNKK